MRPKPPVMKKHPGCISQPDASQTTGHEFAHLTHASSLFQPNAWSLFIPHGAIVRSFVISHRANVRSLFIPHQADVRSCPPPMSNCSCFCRFSKQMPDLCSLPSSKCSPLGRPQSSKCPVIAIPHATIVSSWSFTIKQ